MSTFHKPVRALIAAMAGMTLSASLMASEPDRLNPSQYNETVKGARSDYDAALKACGTNTGAERTACRREARANRDRALSEAKARRAPMARSSEPKSANETAGASATGRTPVAKDSNMASPQS